jgi:hypothetical protein
MDLPWQREGLQGKLLGNRGIGSVSPLLSKISAILLHNRQYIVSYFHLQSYAKHEVTYANFDVRYCTNQFDLFDLLNMLVLLPGASKNTPMS